MVGLHDASLAPGGAGRAKIFNAVLASGGAVSAPGNGFAGYIATVRADGFQQEWSRSGTVAGNVCLGEKDGSA